MRLLHGEGGVEFAADGEGGNRLQDRERWTTLALQGSVVDANLIVRETEARRRGHRNHVEFTQSHIAFIDIDFEP